MRAAPCSGSCSRAPVAGRRDAARRARTALAGARGLLVVDEPTSRLDRSGAAAVAELLVAASRQDEQTIVCATHDVELIGRADDVIELGREPGS